MVLNSLKEKSRNCIGCGACISKCSQGAISMEKDELGFGYAAIDSKKCVGCGNCEASCPVLTEKPSNSVNPICYSVIAEPEIQLASTSGGAFHVLATDVLQRNGCVCGVSFEGMECKYTVVDNETDLMKLVGAKYIEAELGNIFEQVKEILDQDKPLLFCGTPCHVQALYNYLDDDYNNLATVDFVCHGVSSPYVFKKYTEYLSEKNSKKLVDYSFSKKVNGYTPDRGMAYYEDGTSEEDFDFHFLHNSCVSLRKSCFSCNFAELPRCADITLGYCYGIETILPDFFDKNGVSMVMLNSKVGRWLFNRVKDNFAKTAQINARDVITHNRFFANFMPNPKRERLAALVENGVDFSKIMQYIKYDTYDVAVIADWSSYNFGAHITNYALFNTVKALGYEPLMVEKPNVHPWPPLDKPVLFRNNPYPSYALSPLFASFQDLAFLNSRCAKFLVGADNVWNYQWFGHSLDLYTLPFAADTHTRLAYGTSFGADSFVDETFISPEEAEMAKKRFSANIKNFDYIGVRDSAAEGILKTDFDRSSEIVLDPVFIADTEIYQKMIEKSAARLPKNYAFAYFFSKAPGLQDSLPDFCEANDMSFVLAPDPSAISAFSTDFSVPFYSNLSVEDWLSYINNSECVFTDSYYAVCMSLILKKNFYYIGSSPDVVHLLTSLKLIDRIFDTISDITEEASVSQIDYSDVSKILEPLAASSLKSLETALNMEKAQNGKNHE